MSELPVFPFDIPHEVDAPEEFARLRAEKPVLKVRLAPGGEAYLVSRYEDVRRVYADPLFSRAETNRPEVPLLLPGNKLPDVMLNMDPPQHTRLRKLVAREFTAGPVERLTPRVRTIAEALADRMVAAGPPADFVAGFALPAAGVRDLRAHGRAARRRRPPPLWLKHILSISAHTAEETRNAVGELMGYIAGLIAAKRDNPGEDLISGLVQARDENGEQLSETELVFLVHLLIAGGYETRRRCCPTRCVTFRGTPASGGGSSTTRPDPDRRRGAAAVRAHHPLRARAGGPRTSSSPARRSPPGRPCCRCRTRRTSTAVRAGPAAARRRASAGRAPRLRPRRPPLRGAPLARAELRIALEVLTSRVPGLRLATGLDGSSGRKG